MSVPCKIMCLVLQAVQRSSNVDVISRSLLKGGRRAQVNHEMDVCDKRGARSVRNKAEAESDFFLME